MGRELDPAGKRALVTGASGGAGAATVWLAARAGARAGISHRNRGRELRRSPCSGGFIHGLPGRVATAEDGAGPIVMLRSGSARHISGEVVNVNGGAVPAG